MNTEANFDTLYLVRHLDLRYGGLSTYEINVLLYLSQLLSVYDENSIADWGYYFTHNEYGAPLSTAVIKQIEYLTKTGILSQDESKYVTLYDTLQGFEQFEHLTVFEWRKKYLNASIILSLSKTIPQISNALQCEPGIRKLAKIKRTSTLYAYSDTKHEEVFQDFHIIKSIITTNPGDVLVPASVWIDHLIKTSESQSL